MPVETRDNEYYKYKQCLIIRNDVKMSCGKKCAQLAHAAVGAYEHADKTVKKLWYAEGMKKVVLKVDSLQALYLIKTNADMAGFSTSLICDAGHTEVEPGTVTALGIGPAKSEELDKITGKLQLL
ncbi:MAG: peptidyl-tRNA hydrolase Pth2 [Methanomicrobium sp.]|nr:peptidyl-tRNA hydrolase [Methanomicrobium sp.]MBO4521951.1 peptidyl-tRNA hydrolase [Methanomicrobium sp.]MBP5083868.1 peptidyl-tRNA hydrolase [Methanomicrobium sp.]MBR6010787.1 peptidyl-tRNA hydrolase Pth2 [Methanomicrobium sp.]